MELVHPARAPRPRRSMLYVPGSNPRALEKATGLPADGLIFDLEDSVLPEMKTEARERLVEALQAGRHGRREKVVRVNALGTPWGEDDVLAVAAARGIDAVLLPKVEGPEAIAQGVALLERAGADDTVGLMAMIETPLGVLRAEAIAAASPRLVAFVLGTNDLEGLTRARPTPDRLPVLTALSLAVLAARAHGLGVVDGIHPQLDDPEGLEQACRQGLDLGFDGKSLIHPSQIDAANRVFSPHADEVAEARAIVQAFEEARALGRGVALANGRLVERLHVRMAERTLRLVRGIRDLEGSAE